MKYTSNLTIAELEHDMTNRALSAEHREACKKELEARNTYGIKLNQIRNVLKDIEPEDRTTAEQTIWSILNN